MSIKQNEIEANYADGVLRIAVPKAEATKKLVVKVGEGKPSVWDKFLGQNKKTEVKSTH